MCKNICIYIYIYIYIYTYEEFTGLARDSAASNYLKLP